MFLDVCRRQSRIACLGATIIALLIVCGTMPITAAPGRLPMTYARDALADRVDPTLNESGPTFEYQPGSWGLPQAETLVADVGGWNTPQ